MTQVSYIQRSCCIICCKTTDHLSIVVVLSLIHLPYINYLSATNILLLNLTNKVGNTESDCDSSFAPATHESKKGTYAWFVCVVYCCGA